MSSGKIITAKSLIKNTIIRFKIDTKLGQGSYGEVLRVIDLSNQMPVALKIIRTGRESLREATKEFRASIYLQQHSLCQSQTMTGATTTTTTTTTTTPTNECGLPMVCALDIIELEGDDVGIIFPLQNLFTLREMLTFNEFTDHPNYYLYATRLIRSLLLNVSKLHVKQFYHLDIKPENIFVDTSNLKFCAYLIDFGQSCVINHEHLDCEGSHLKGSPFFSDTQRHLKKTMELRASASEGITDVRENLAEDADLYALGVNIYLILMKKAGFTVNENSKTWKPILANLDEKGQTNADRSLLSYMKDYILKHLIERDEHIDEISNRLIDDFSDIKLAFYNDESHPIDREKFETANVRLALKLNCVTLR